MDHADLSTEDLHFAYRVVAMLASLERGDEVSGHVLAAAEELLRIAYRARTLHDPLPGQLDLGE